MGGAVTGQYKVIVGGAVTGQYRQDGGLVRTQGETGGTVMKKAVTGQYR